MSDASAAPDPLLADPLAQLPGLEVLRVPILSDNYAYILRDVESDTVGVLDPGAAEPMRAALEARGWGLDWILLTHHHADHIDGAAALQAAFGAKLAGAAQDGARLPPLDAALKTGEDWDFGSHIVEIIDTPGHTVGHIAYHFPRAQCAFVGDTLFALGCGRMFEGTALQFWGALMALKALPHETLIYCGHEYTLSNARFAAGVEPGNAALTDRVAEIEQLRADGVATIPTRLGRELATNPFLRADEASVQEALGLAGADPAAVFAEIRRRKDAA